MSKKPNKIEIFLASGLSCHSTEPQIITSYVANLIALPAEFLDGKAKIGEVGNIAGS